MTNIGNAGTSGNLGTGNIKIGTGSTTSTLLYRGTGETTNKIVDLGGTFISQIDHSGSNLLKFTADFFSTGGMPVSHWSCRATRRDWAKLPAPSSITAP